MRLVVTFLYFACSCQTGGADHGGAPESILGELGHTVTLPCHDLAVTVPPALTQWLKDGSIVVKRNHSSELSPRLGHFTILDNGSLNITGLMAIDEGSYECECSLQDTSKVHNHTGVHLHIFSGPDKVILDISPVEKLPNGTLYVRNDSTVYFKCSSPSISYPSRTLSLMFEGASSNKDTLVSGNGSLIQYEELNITPNRQGDHSCSAENTISKKIVTESLQLLVYYPPERHPVCTWRIQSNSSSVLFSCSWRGGYPAPTLQWEDLTSKGVVLNSSVNETLEVILNRSVLSDGHELKCQGKHVMSQGDEYSCHFTLKTPYPEGEPLVTVVEGSNVTLTCIEKQSIPPAKTIWQRTVAHKDIKLGSKYVISEQGPTFSLTIVNITKDDEGTYFCRSENPIAVRELEVYLTVKSSVSYTGGIVGTFLSVLILGAGISIGMAIYSNRHRICLGYHFGFLTEERNDVLNLVESDDEIFTEAVPRLPVLPNGHSTTLVEIHRIPSSKSRPPEMIMKIWKTQRQLKKTKTLLLWQNRRLQSYILDIVNISVDILPILLSEQFVN
ncbi:V-set and immunoglobulin domain-containing protein 10 isoform X1 [Clupea harengus]|uniref:V-set and immunoglobulin domain-containing protein 10 isoform X1 n=1 Tax=Clupea harengus TaxID=7950 RepID=UPI0012AC0EB4|nr:V-set and immunoglobulin domain-containing protein 10 isoform X1 [Clupea harengus]